MILIKFYSSVFLICDNLIFSRSKDSQYKDETVVRPYHVYNMNAFTDKTASLY